MSRPIDKEDLSANNASTPCETTPLKSTPPAIGNVTLQAAIVRIVTCIVSLAEGYDGAVFGACATRLIKEFDLTPWSLGLLAALSPMACLVGAPTAGFLMNHMGRKPLLFIVCLIISLGALVQALAHTVLVLGVGRFIIGLGCGAGMTTVTVYVAEVSPAKVRGLLTSLEEIFINIGISAAFFAGWVMLGPGGLGWRGCMVLGVFLPLVAAGMLPWTWTPESPRYYLLCGQPEKARSAMIQLGISSEEADQAMDAWTNQTPRANEPWVQMKTHQKPLSLAIGVALANMVTGIAAIHALAPWILSSKMPEEKALEWAMIISTIKFLILFPVCFFLLDHVGRRPLLCVSSVIYALAAAFTAFAFMKGLPGEAVGVGVGVALCSFSGGMGPATWPYIAEVLPTVIRGHGTGVALMSGRVLACLWLLFFPALFAWNAPAAFGTIACATCLGCVFYFVACPETRQKTLESIQQSWTKEP